MDKINLEDIHPASPVYVEIGKEVELTYKDVSKGKIVCIRVSVQAEPVGPEEEGGCKGCIFDGSLACHTVACAAYERKDKQAVIFKGIKP